MFISEKKKIYTLNIFFTANYNEAKKGQKIV